MMKRLLMPLVFLLVFIAESTFAEVLPAEVFHSPRIFVPRFLIVFILFLTIYGSKKHGILFGMAFGLLFDVVYTEIIGIYLFLFPLLSYVISLIMKVMQSNIVVVSLVTILGISLLEIVVYYTNFLLNMTVMDFAYFAEFRLLPTVILNLAFIIIVAYPLKKNFEKMSEDLQEELI